MRLFRHSDKSQSSRHYDDTAFVVLEITFLANILICICIYTQGWCGKQFATKPSPYLYVDKFAVKKWRASSNIPACVDVMSTGIRGTCTPHILERVFATSQVRLIDQFGLLLLLQDNRPHDYIKHVVKCGAEDFIF